MPTPSPAVEYLFHISSKVSDRKEGSMILMWSVSSYGDASVKMCYCSSGKWYADASNTTVTETISGDAVNYAVSVYFEDGSVCKAAFLPPLPDNFCINWVSPTERQVA